MQDAEGIITLPGARELLLQLPAKRWTIATSCTRLLAEVRQRGGFTSSRADRDLYRCDPGQAASRTISEGRCKVGLYRPCLRCRGRCSRGDQPAGRLGRESSLSIPPSKRQSYGARVPILSCITAPRCRRRAQLRGGGLNSQWHARRK
jgi:hypothetical protein